MSDRQYIEMPGSQELYREFNMVEAVRAGDMVFVSGQVGWDEEMNVVEGLEAQSRPAFQKLKTILEKSGAEPRHITRFGFFFVDDTGQDLMDLVGVVMGAKKAVMPECRAAGTGVRVAELADTRLVIEIEATAVVID